MKNMEKIINVAKAIMPNAEVVEVFRYDNGLDRFVSFDDNFTSVEIADGSNIIEIKHDRSKKVFKYSHIDNDTYKTKFAIADDIITHMDNNYDDAYAFIIKDGHAYAM